MPASWKDVRRARIPVDDVPVLAELRGQAGIRVMVAGEFAWVSWEPGLDLMQDILLRRILPLEGAELYTERNGRWYRLGEHLPRFDMPAGDGSEWLPLERTIFLKPIEAVRARGSVNDPMSIRLVRDLATPGWPASALRCPLDAISAWAERATSAQLARLTGAWVGSGSPERPGAEALVIGPDGSLPLLPECLRFWGSDLLIPLGYRAEPDLPASAIRRAAGARADELAVLDQDGLELIPRAIFKPLSRAGIRLIGGGGKEDVPGKGAST
jgi:MoxR-vWA-beta-propeller ternary system protein